MPPLNFDDAAERDTREFVAAINRRHLATRPESDLAARIKSYELAAKCSSSIPSVTEPGL